MFFNTEQAEMLYEINYQGAFIESIKEGDQIAIRNLGAYREGEPEIKFVTVTNLSIRSRGDEYGPLFNFIGVYENGRQEPMSYGEGYPIAIKEDS